LKANKVIKQPIEEWVEEITKLNRFCSRNGHPENLILILIDTFEMDDDMFGVWRNIPKIEKNPPFGLQTCSRKAAGVMGEDFFAQAPNVLGQAAQTRKLGQAAQRRRQKPDSMLWSLRVLKNSSEKCTFSFLK
jgi:hypothetical protein